MSIDLSSPRFFAYPGAAAETIPLAAAAGDLVFYGGGVAAHPERGVPEGIRPFDGYPNHWSQVNRELCSIYGTMDQVLGQAGSDLRQLLKINSFHVHESDVYEALRMRPEIFGEFPPPSTLVLEPELSVRDLRVAVDGIALRSASAFAREALTTSTDSAPMPPHQKIWGKTIYSKAVKGGGFIFTSGRTNNVIGGATDSELRGHHDFPYRGDHAETSCRVVLQYLEDVLASFKADFSKVVKAEIHLNDMTQIAAIERVWREIFGDDPPARIFIPATFPTPYTTLEIELVALDPEGPWDREAIALPAQASERVCEPRAIRAGPYVFFSGLCATDYVNGLAPAARVDPALPFHEDPMHKQVDYVAKMLEEACPGAVPLRCRFMTPELERYGVFLGAWASSMGRIAMPITAFRTPGPLPVPSAAFQLDLVAWAG
ncbi:RidA family protein [Pusillimonas caeni]|uniref:RidA family protein n=1 Tax=Pusillimonas caeni TaxID=1348472 RepID=UPI000E59DE1D|nr:RidA family protein [Pusillimonas caeni]TFL14999.1 RidA family protein [Pusillimonas caeni]